MVDAAATSRDISLSLRKDGAMRRQKYCTPDSESRKFVVGAIIYRHAKLWVLAMAMGCKLGPANPAIVTLIS